MHLRRAAKYPARRQIDTDVAEGELCFRRTFLTRASAQRDTDSRQQLADTERLGEIVVGACIQRLDLLLLIAPRRQDDDRSRVPFAQAQHDIDPIGIRQPQVEDEQIGFSRCCLYESVGAALRLENSERLRRKPRAQKTPDLRIVFDNDDRRRGPVHGAVRADDSDSVSDSTVGGSAAGNSKRNSAPPPGRFIAMIVPPCATMIALQIARPSPTPLCADSDLSR